MMGGGAASGGGSGGGSTANVYIPKQQGTADWNWNQIIQPLIDASAGGGAGTPAAWAYPQAQELFRSFYLPPSEVQNARDDAWLASNWYRDTAFPQLSGGVSSLLATSMDPQSALYNRSKQELTDASNAQAAASGVAGTPYGASVTSNALSNFGIDWQNKQLQRQLAGLQGATSAAGTTASDLAKLGATPYNYLSQIGQNALSGLSGITNIGNNQYLLPEQVLQNLQAYMRLGQNASTISGQLGNLGVSQLGSAISGLGSLAGTANNLFGSNGLFGSSGLLSGLGSSLTGGGTGLSADALGIADAGLFGGGGDILSGGAGLGGLDAAGLGIEEAGSFGGGSFLADAAPFALSA